MACSSLPLIAPGPSPSVSPMAWAVTAWSPVIMRTSMPAPSATSTASFASGRSGSMMPTIADEAEVAGERHRVLRTARQVGVVDQAGGERQHAQALAAHLLVGRLDAGTLLVDRRPGSRSAALPAGTGRVRRPGRP